MVYNVYKNDSKRYYGMGSLSFYEECAQDELALFEAGILSDIKETTLTESYELAALNEGFVETAKKAISEAMAKFVSWLESVLRSVVAKMNEVIVRDNVKFATSAKKILSKMKNSDKISFSGKCLDVSKIKSVIASEDKDEKDAEKDLLDAITKDTSSEDINKIIEAIEKKTSDEASVSKFMEGVTKEVKDEGVKIIEEHIKVLEDMGSDVKHLKDQMAKYKKAAADVAKAAKQFKKESDSEEGKKEANAKVKAANKYKSVCQKYINKQIGIIKAVAKLARAVVTKGLAKHIKNSEEKVSESFIFESDEVLVNAMCEAYDYEVDSTLEDIGKDDVADECNEDADEESEEELDDTVNEFFF